VALGGGSSVLALVVVAAGGVAASSRAAAIQVELDAPAGCSDADTFWRGARARQYLRG